MSRAANVRASGETHPIARRRALSRVASVASVTSAAAMIAAFIAACSSTNDGAREAPDGASADGSTMSPRADAASESAATDASDPISPRDAAADGAASCPLLDAAGLAQMSALVGAAKSFAAGNAPGGHCYAAVAKYIDTVGYGAIPKQPADKVGTLPSVPDAYGEYAHQFADYMNAVDTNTGHSHGFELGLQRLALDNPYDAPVGSIIVVRAGAPGTADPVAGDISVAAGNGLFYNDGEMSYVSAASFPAGNDFVLGIYAPSPSCASEWLCASDTDCNHGAPGTGRVCASAESVCIFGCHGDGDCPAGKHCAPTEPHYSCE